MSAPSFSLDNTPPELRFAPPAERAAEAMTNYLKTMQPPQQNMPINRLSDIALLCRQLTYGEMMELASGLISTGSVDDHKLPQIIWNWAHSYGN